MLFLIIVFVVVLFITTEGTDKYHSLESQQALVKGCNTWKIQNNCNIDNRASITIQDYQVPATGGGTKAGTLSDACGRTGASDVNACRTVCGCPGA